MFPHRNQVPGLVRPKLLCKHIEISGNKINLTVVGQLL